MSFLTILSCAIHMSVVKSHSPSMESEADKALPRYHGPPSISEHNTNHGRIQSKVSFTPRTCAFSAPHTRAKNNTFACFWPLVSALTRLAFQLSPLKSNFPRENNVGPSTGSLSWPTTFSSSRLLVMFLSFFTLSPCQIPKGQRERDMEFGKRHFHPSPLQNKGAFPKIFCFLGCLT